MNRLTLYMHPDTSSLDQTVERFQADMVNLGFDSDYAFQYSVCLAEALNNILEHTPTTWLTEKDIIQINVFIFSSSMMTDIAYRAPKFRVESREPKGQIADRGRGCSIMKLWLDEFAYSHEQGCNHLKMIKQL
jgi:anti-sigma regulatory factor (Ser/Thr protein kinase)